MAAPVHNGNFDQAMTIFDKAFRQLKQSVSNNDAELFQSTTLQDVEQAAIAIEERQRQRKSMRNMARIKPFFTALEKYSKVIDVLCNGTDYLPWIWAPIKLMLQIASEFGNVIDTLLNAYNQIAIVMPDFSRIGAAFRDNPHVREILAHIYEDILEFHQRAYKFLRRRSWYIFFDSLWKSFEGGRLNAIIKNISCHRDLLMREVVLTDLIDAKKSRDIAREQLEERERKKEYTHLHDSIAWLKIADEGQLDVLDGLLTTRQDGTCEWVLQNQTFLSWRDDAHAEPIIWLNGIPGAGKTVLCSYVINSLKEDARISAPFYICNSYTSGKNLLSEILRSLTAQLLRANKDLAPHIFDKYANTGLAPSIAHLRNLLPDLLKTITTVRMCIDGLDEFPDGDQRKIINELASFSKASQGQFRILFSSREVTLIERAMKGRPLISLKTEATAVSSDIAAYVHDRLAFIHDEFDTEFVAKIERQVVSKANGMFLWVRLIIANIENCHSRRELQQAVDELPEGLDQAYGRILGRVLNELGEHNSQKAIRILEWIACSFRILKLHEVQDGIVFDTPGAVLDEESKLSARILDLCKPLIQDGPNNSVEFVHYSAKEYILHKASGPFLKYYKAHHDIAFACILYLNSSLCFYDVEVTETYLKLRVLKGLHGLHHYANEFWFQHLLQYAKSGERVENEANMEEAVEDLLEAWKEDPGIATTRLKLDDTTTKDNIENEIMALKDNEHAYGMGQDLLTLRAFLAQEKYAHQEAKDLKTLELKHDPTYLSDISQRYQEIVQFFMNCNVDDLPAGSTPEMIDQFRAIYLDAAFICRYRNCPRFSDGFKTMPDRDEHEKGHIKPLRCADPSCDFFERGFNSRTGLLKHNRKYHPKPEEVEPPSFESIKAPPPPVFVPPPAQLPPPPRPITPPRQPTPPPVEPPRPIQAEPRKKRVSRAKKGLRVHQCNACPKIFTRAEGLRRHQVTHTEPTFFCNISGCGKAFHREDLLNRHLARHENRAKVAGDEDLSEDEESLPAIPRLPSIQNIMNFWDSPTL